MNIDDKFEYHSIRISLFSEPIIVPRRNGNAPSQQERRNPFRHVNYTDLCTRTSRTSFSCNSIHLIQGIFLRNFLLHLLGAIAADPSNPGNDTAKRGISPGACRDYAVIPHTTVDHLYGFARINATEPAQYNHSRFVCETVV